MTIDALRERALRAPLLLDGAMATYVHATTGGVGAVAATDALTWSRPALVRDVHGAYLAAGADIIRTNTFRAAAREHAADARELCRGAARLAREAADEWSRRTPGRPRIVAGAIGPADHSEPLEGRTAAARDRETFRPPLTGLLEGDADLLLFETWWCPAQTEGALRALADACADAGRRLPVLVSTVLGRDGRVAASGVSLEAWLDAIDPAAVDGVGVNCGTGPERLAAPLSTLGARPWLVSCAPSAGVPGGEGDRPCEPEPFARAVAAYVTAGLVQIAGGCCGTTPAHVRALAAALAAPGGISPAPPNAVATPRRAGTQ